MRKYNSLKRPAHHAAYKVAFKYDVLNKLVENHGHFDFEQTLTRIIRTLILTCVCVRKTLVMDDESVEEQMPIKEM